ncbi:MAG: hypothetical protein KDK34_09725, partial [Leptospiraceae bacterium]|nr:hypothetical protein [Leptospiraceae bacterium]
YNHVYGSREFIKEHRAELLQYFNEQLNNEAVIIHENRAMTLKDDSQKKEIYRALYDYIRYRVKSE